MSKSCGRLFNVEVNHPTLGWVVIPGTRSDSSDATNEQVDTTDKQGAPFRFLKNCGLYSVALQSDGVIKRSAPTAEDPTGDAVWNYLIQVNSFNEYIELRCVSPATATKVFYSGKYLSIGLNRSGDNNNAETFSLTFESAGPLVSGDFPLFSIFPPEIFAHGWGVTRLNVDYTGPVGTMYRVSDGATEELLFIDNNNGSVADVQQVANFAQGSEVLLIFWYDQAPPGNLPNGDPEPPLHAFNNDINRAPRITDESGNVLVNSAGILEIEFQQASDESFKELKTDIRNYNPVNADSAIGGFVVNPRAWSNDDSLIYHPQLSFRTYTDTGAGRTGGRVFGAGPVLNADVPGFDGTQQAVYTGMLGDNTDKQLMINGVLSPDSIPAVNQSWGVADFNIGHGTGGGSGYRGRMQQGWFYFADPAKLTPEFINDFLPEIQSAVADSCGFSF